MITHAEIIDKLKFIAKEAGREIMKIYQRDFAVNYKSGNNPVTDADIVANSIIEKGLLKFGYPILSEETLDDARRLSAKRIWIVDPLDGTKDFIAKTGEFCIMIGLVENTQPILGVIYKPADGSFYYAVKNQGAFFEHEKGESEKLHVSAEKNIANARMLLSRHHILPKELECAQKLGINNRVKCGSSGVKAAVVAQGNAELYVNASDTTGEWDVCAADILIKEAGGKITDIYSKNLLYNKRTPKQNHGFIISNGLIHEIVVKELANLW